MDVITLVWLIGFMFTVGILLSDNDNITEDKWLFFSTVFAACVLWPLMLGIFTGHMISGDK
jgi:hypothetical protein